MYKCIQFASPVQSMNAQLVAYSHLKKEILAGTLRAGTAINPEEIGKRLGLSRTPVREAIFRLDQEGLVSFGANRRAVVTALTASQILELFEIRIALEGLAIERAVRRLTGQIIDDLEFDLIRMDRATGDPKRWLTLHDEFHDRIYRAAEMPRLSEEIARLRQSIRPYFLMYYDVFQAPEMPGFEHASLVQVLRRMDSALARIALADHIRNAGACVVSVLTKDPLVPLARAEPKGWLAKAKEEAT